MAWELILNFPNSMDNTQSHENNHIWGTEIFWTQKKLSVKSSSLSPLVTSFNGIRKVRKFYKIWVWNAETQHLMHKVQRVIIVVVQVGAVKTYVAALDALKKQERGGWNTLYL